MRSALVEDNAIVAHERGQHERGQEEDPTPPLANEEEVVCCPSPKLMLFRLITVLLIWGMGGLSWILFTISDFGYVRFFSVKVTLFEFLLAFGDMRYPSQFLPVS
jgi:hypothetical protein